MRLGDTHTQTQTEGKSEHSSSVRGAGWGVAVGVPVKGGHTVRLGVPSHWLGALTGPPRGPGSLLAEGQPHGAP